ncbi:ParB/RepB/Spo0J family partition protein [Nonomuraea sp. NPDC050536]|uniref:ParB/RepB/Spo0J family partition protein n=1 Tax=Nonomuraea sp. NPDC050536 TaxID=3364366 RepID=UPI0037C605F3
MSFSRVEKISLDRLVIGDRQVRTREVEEDIDELVANIRVHGQLEPIIVAPLNDHDGHYEILAGQRRWLAMRRLGAREITAAVIAERPDRDVASALSISENLIRRDLSVLDLIDACTSLYNRYGSIKAVAERFGLPYGRVRGYVKFDRLRPELKELVRDGAIDLKTAIRLEDHCQRGDVDERQLRQLAAEVAGMSMAQQSDFLGAGPEVGPETGSVPHKPGSVKQIIVTLTIADLEALRAWARTKNLTQDRAGARIIASFLRDIAHEVSRNA